MTLGNVNYKVLIYLIGGMPKRSRYVGDAVSSQRGKCSQLLMMKGMMTRVSLIAMPKAVLRLNARGTSKSVSTSLCKEIAGVSAKCALGNFVAMRSLLQ